MKTIDQRLNAAVRDIPDFPKPGILFKDITPILLDAQLCKDLTDTMYSNFEGVKVDGIVGIESRGFLFGLMLSQKFNVPFIPVRKQGKLPYKTNSYKYDLEYGSSIVEVHADAISKGKNYLIHDDLLATGGTASAAAELIKMQNGNIAGFVFLIGLEFLPGRKVLTKYSDRISTLLSCQ